MSNFETCIQFVLQNEGGFVANEKGNDKGGTTNFGISLNFLKKIPVQKLNEYGISVSPDKLRSNDIENLNRDQALLIYRDNFWLPTNLDKVKSPIIAAYVLDMVVNYGILQGVKILQRGICAVHRIRDLLSEDGDLGPRTLGFINNASEKELLSVLIALRVSFYRMLVQTNPTQKEFLNGWIQRTYSIGSLVGSI